MRHACCHTCDDKQSQLVQNAYVATRVFGRPNDLFPLSEDRSMNQRWSRLLRALGEFRRLLKRRHLIPVGSLIGCLDAALADCKNRLAEVLLPEAEHSLLVNRLNNAHASFERGEFGAAHWEAAQAHRRANSLRRLNA
jgi:hypothetical protein